MAFSEIYDITFPPDTQAISQGALDIRNFKQDIAQRVANLSGITVAEAESLGYETNFYGAPFIDSTTGKVYNIGGTFTEITPLILANISESNTTLQAAIVAAIAAIPPTSPGPLVLPALVGLQSPQITDGPGGDVTTIPTISQAAGIITPTRPASAGYVQAAQAALTAVAVGGNCVKIPLTFSAVGVALTWFMVQWGTTGDLAGSPVVVTFSPAFSATPGLVAATNSFTTFNDRISAIYSITAGGFTANNNGSGAGVNWIAVGMA